MGFLDSLLGKPTVESFARTLIERAAASGEPGWKFDASESQLTLREGQVINLGNMFREYSQASRGDRPSLLDKYAALMSDAFREIPKLWTLAQKSIVPLVRDGRDEFHLEIRSRDGGGAFSPRIDLSWMPPLVIRISYDLGSAIAQCSRDLLDTWGVSAESVRARAQQNLQALPRPTWSKLSAGLWILESAEGYQESMVLRTDVLASLPARGQAWLIAPNRGILLGTGSDEPGGLAALLQEAESALQQKPWPMPPVLWHWDGTTLTAPELDGTPGETLRRLRRIDEATLYADQQAALNTMFERTNVDIFVASVQLISREGGTLVQSYSTWTQDVLTLLPETDLYAINRVLGPGKYDTLLVPKTAVIEICGAHLQPTTENPARWRVDSFPSEQEWELLKARTAFADRS